MTIPPAARRCPWRYSFVGFETSANLAEETVDSRRNDPRALIGGILLAGVLFAAVGLRGNATGS